VYEDTVFFIYYLEVKWISLYAIGSQDSSMGIVTGFRLGGWSSIPSRGKRFVSTPPSAMEDSHNTVIVEIA
jgi:hypothetical protein